VDCPLWIESGGYDVSMRHPLLVLDVDGVLNLFAGEEPVRVCAAAGRVAPTLLVRADPEVGLRWDAVAQLRAWASRSGLP
jgi:hypothetical protein